MVLKYDEWKELLSLNDSQKSKNNFLFKAFEENRNISDHFYFAGVSE